MEKLVELLNEYDKNHHNKSDLYYLFEIEDWMLFCYDDVTDVQRTMQDEAMVICSKKFWFIKRLVDNNKIDRDEYLTVKSRALIWTLWVIKNKEREAYTKCDNELVYESLLMQLSTEDNPISFLTSILK